MIIECYRLLRAALNNLRIGELVVLNKITHKITTKYSISPKMKSIILYSASGNYRDHLLSTTLNTRIGTIKLRPDFSTYFLDILAGVFFTVSKVKLDELEFSYP